MARTLSLRYSGFKIHSSTTRTKHSNGDIALHLVRLLSMPRLLVISLWSFLLYSTRVLDVAGHANTLIKLGITISTMNHYGRSDSISLRYSRSMVEGVSGTIAFCPYETMGTHENPEFSLRRCSFKIGQSISPPYSKCTLSVVCTVL